ncbi:hypothetical protein AMJ52_05755 [candidate division TA06 bacterium DG_78]|uniref:O-antigen polymerase n=1 Tax=candidate division TA06 bacterium DG_78 TaxID=1703772 RepID=A0A0S7YD89_UNCT6|nr:MAG: hypothetical protein AMJ52_05755 [candidate division TA06 bacterium DG_78]
MYITSKKLKSELIYIIPILVGLIFTLIYVRYNILTFVLLAIILFIALFFLSTKVAFLLLFFVRPIIDFYWNKPLFGLKNPLYIIGGIVVLLMIMFILIRKINFLKIPYSGLIIFFLLTQLIAFIMTIFTNSQAWFNASLIFMKIISGFLFFLAMPFIFKTKKDIDSLINIILLSTIIPLAISFYVWFRGDPGIFSAYFSGGEEIGRGVIILSQGLQRLSGLYQGTFYIAFLILLVLFFGTFKLYFLKDNKWRNMLLIYMLISLIPLYQTYFRAGWGMALVGMGVWFLLKNKKFSFIFLIVGVILFFLFSESAQFRFTNEFAFLRGTGEFENIGSGRGSEWLRYIDIYFHQFSPLEKLFGKMGAIGNPENQFLYLLVTTGIFGLLGYFVLMIGIGWKLFKSFRRQRDNFNKNLLLLAFVLHVVFILATVGGTPLLWVNAQWVVWSIIGIALYHARLSDHNHPISQYE